MRLSSVLETAWSILSCVARDEKKRRFSNEGHKTVLQDRG